ncbi:glutathione S-transferase [Neosynechococcus sphagnicola sy1]|uniref:Glutathione S-transferase n=1 Tax=Neosynechococcus sphagnicola sy1 TaxID=1497020 RepID=A0A098TNA5_9CYAN|nr:glutathione S-transferase [Neosynechococcus sphagnicola]KGF73810.1 glutathione S-transferase [Neosynechococcus sphagnicola sy1]
MHLLQFSTSHYCRKARLALGYKQLTYTVENLTPGLHILKLKPLTGLSTVPVLLPQQPGTILGDQSVSGGAAMPQAIADSTRILHFLETHYPQPSLLPISPEQQAEAWLLEDWLDESIGTATRFVYYDFRAGAGKQLDSSLTSQLLIQLILKQYGINAATVVLAAERLQLALVELGHRWQSGPYLVGDQLSVADVAAAALLSPLVRVPLYRDTFPQIFERIAEIHHQCQEPLPPGL